MKDSPWNDAMIAKLRVLWAEGLSTAEIGRRLNVSKCSVIGKAHRLGLPPRPSPIKSSSEEKKAVPARMPRVAPCHDDEPHVAEARPVKRIGISQPCCWPLGTPRTPDFRFCMAAGVPGKPYCLEHAARAYVRVEKLSEAAA